MLQSIQSNRVCRYSINYGIFFPLDNFFSPISRLIFGLNDTTACYA